MASYLTGKYQEKAEDHYYGTFSTIDREHLEQLVELRNIAAPCTFNYAPPRKRVVKTAPQPQTLVGAASALQGTE